MAVDHCKPISGMSDIVPPEVYLWQHLEKIAREVFSLYAVEEIRTPTIEYAEIFDRSLGDGTDVVQKEMYRFTDRGGRHLALRPEGTAGVIRHLAGAGQEARSARVFYMGPMFRSERPQAGRRRQFHQVGVEALGPPSPAADAEIIALQAHLLSAWGLNDFTIEINTRGLPADSQRMENGIRDALRSKLDMLCEDCQKRFESNPLRILDCKNPSCQTIIADVPPLTSFMSDEAHQHLKDVLSILKRLEIPVKENERLVRGLDYYAHTVWEIKHSGLGAQDALAGGGRYALAIGRDPLEGVGFAIGMERIVAALTTQGIDPATYGRRPRVWLVSQGALAFDDNILLMQTLRLRGISCGMDLCGRSMKAQMRAANRAKAPWVVIRGDQEMQKGLFVLKHMEDGSQEELDMPELMSRLLENHHLEESLD